MRNKIQKTSQEANKQLLHRESNMNKQTGDTTSSDSINPSEESQTSAHNKTTMEKETISVNASQGGAAELFLGGGNCGKENAEGTGSAEVKTYIKKGGDNVG